MVSELEMLVSIWIQAAFSLMVYTFLVKPTVIYEFVTHTIVGAVSGYTVAVAVRNIYKLAWIPLTTAGQFLLIIPLIVGPLILLRISKKYAWLSRYPTSVMIGLGIGLSITRYVEAQFIMQIKATLLPVFGVAPLIAFNNLLIVIIVLVTTSYFIFTIPKVTRSRSYGWIEKLGRYAMMIGFGATYGSAVVSRLTDLLGSVSHLLFQWLRLVPG